MDSDDKLQAVAEARASQFVSSGAHIRGRGDFENDICLVHTNLPLLRQSARLAGIQQRHSRRACAHARTATTRTARERLSDTYAVCPFGVNASPSAESGTRVGGSIRF